MQKINNLIEDYQRRSSNIESQLKSSKCKEDNVNINRLSAKLHCYKTFVVELERLVDEINEKNQRI